MMQSATEEAGLGSVSALRLHWLPDSYSRTETSEPPASTATKQTNKQTNTRARSCHCRYPPQPLAPCVIAHSGRQKAFCWSCFSRKVALVFSRFQQVSPREENGSLFSLLISSDRLVRVHMKPDQAAVMRLSHKTELN